jgi:hypothetical protein
MEARELRINNLIEVEGNIIEVGIIKEKFISWNVAKYPENKVWNPFIPTNDIRINPIPLTEEWLLKFGFLKLGEGYEFWESSVFNIEFIRNHWHFCYTSNVLCTHIKYLHQLQNLYFALVGEELTIKQTV